MNSKAEQGAALERTLAALGAAQRPFLLAADGAAKAADTLTGALDACAERMDEALGGGYGLARLSEAQNAWGGPEMRYAYADQSGAGFGAAGVYDARGAAEGFWVMPEESVRASGTIENMPYKTRGWGAGQGVPEAVFLPYETFGAPGAERSVPDIVNLPALTYTELPEAAGGAAKSGAGKKAKSSAKSRTSSIEKSAGKAMEGGFLYGDGWRVTTEDAAGTQQLLTALLAAEGAQARFGAASQQSGAYLQQVADAQAAFAADAQVAFAADAGEMLALSADAMGGSFMGAAAAQETFGQSLRNAAEAQDALGQSLAACPLENVAGMAAGVIGLIVTASALTGGAAELAVAAAGLIGESFFSALSFTGELFIGLWNTAADVFATIWNLVAAVANFVGSAFVEPVNAAGRLFFGLADTVLGVLRTLAGAVDAVFGTELAAGVKSWQDSLGAWTDKTFGKGAEFVQRLDADDLKLRTFAAGAGRETSAAKAAGQTGGGITIERQRLLAAAGADDDVKTQVRRVSGNTRAIKDAVADTAEELRELRDIAEAEAINRFTTAQIKIEQTNNNQIDSSLDIDGVVRELTGAVQSAMSMMTEGVYA